MGQDSQKYSKEIKVTEPEELLTFLVNQRIKKSRNATKALLTYKQIKVNNRLVTQYNYRLNVGDIVSINKNDHTRDTKNLKDLSIIFEDEHFIVVDKNTRLLSISTGKEYEETAYGILSQYIKQNDPNARVYVLHRLDRETSGLMIYAKSAHAQEIMQKEWNDYVKERTFAVVVEGQPKPEEGTITSWLTENKNFVMFSSKTENGGLKSTTHYKTIRGTRKFTLLELNLETQRKNQARVHMQSIGHPIVGDKKYGSHINTIKRVAIHADKIVFIHPYTKEYMEFKSPLPTKMKLLVEPIHKQFNNKNQ